MSDTVTIGLRGGPDFQLQMWNFTRSGTTLQLLAYCCKRYMLLTLHFSILMGTPSLRMEMTILERFFSILAFLNPFALPFASGGWRQPGAMDESWLLRSSFSTTMIAITYAGISSRSGPQRKFRYPSTSPHCESLCTPVLTLATFALHWCSNSGNILFRPKTFPPPFEPNSIPGDKA
jgi:hypothetical protein